MPRFRFVFTKVGGFAVLALAGCGGAPSRPAPFVPPTPSTPVVESISVPGAPSESAQAEPAPPPEPEPQPAEEEPTGPTVKTTSLELAPGKACDVTWTAGRVEEKEDGLLVMGVGTIATADSELCDKATVYDDEIERAHACSDVKPGEECFVDYGLEGAHIPMEGTTADSEFHGAEFADLNFDGFRDLCISKQMGAYNYGQRCFLYRPNKRTFEHYPSLDPVIWMTVDAAKKEISHGMRVGGPDYMSAKYRWMGGELTLVEEVFTTLGERETVSKRIGGKMQTVYDGPPRE